MQVLESFGSCFLKASHHFSNISTAVDVTEMNPAVTICVKLNGIAEDS